MSGGDQEAGIMGGSCRLLLIDTCGAEGGVALAEEVEGAWRLRGEDRLPGRSASERLLPAVRALMDDAVWGFSDLSAVAVVTGPGSFTGLRVGLSAAKGLCEALGIPVVAISRLEVLAGAVKAPGARVHALLDAGRGEVFHGVYADGVCGGEDVLTVVEVMAAAEAEPGVVAVVEDTMQIAFPGALRVTEPTAAAALPMAAERLRREEFASVATLDANYLRRTEIEIRQRVEAQARLVEADG